MKHNLLLIIIYTIFSYKNGFSQSLFTLNDSIFQIGQVYKLQYLRFGYHYDHIADENKPELDSIAKLLNRYPTLKIEIGTHTDVRGNDSSNLNLSMLRSNYIKDYLISIGVNPEQLEVKGFGERQPLISEEEINVYKGTDKSKYNSSHLKNNRTYLTIIET